MAMTPKGIYFPEGSTNADFVSIFSTMASSIDSALGDFTYDSGWIGVEDSEMSNGWKSYNQTNSKVHYRKVGKLVSLRGRVRGGDPGKVFNLPSGFRPSSIIWWTNERNGLYQDTVNGQVQTNGSVETRTSGSGSIGWFPMTSCMFFVD